MTKDTDSIAKDNRTLWLCLEKTNSGMYYVLSEHLTRSQAVSNAKILLPSYGVVYIARLRNPSNMKQPYQSKDFSYLSPVYK